MDNRSRGFRAAAAVVMLVFLLAVSAFALAEADPIRVSSLSEPQSVISEQDVSITNKIYKSSQTHMTEEISLYDTTGGVPVSTYNGLQGEQSVTYTGTWHVTQDQIKEGKIKYYIQYSFDSGNGLEKVTFNTSHFHLLAAHPEDSEFPGNNTRAVYQDRSGNIWAGNIDKIIRIYDKDLKYIGNLTAQGKISPNGTDELGIAYSFTQQHTGTIWKRTKGNGLIPATHNGDYKTFRIQQQTVREP